MRENPFKMKEVLEAWGKGITKNEKIKIKDRISEKEENQKLYPPHEVNPEELLKSLFKDAKLDEYEKKILKSKDHNQLSIFRDLKTEISKLISKKELLTKAINKNDSQEVIDEKEKEIKDIDNTINFKNDQLIYMVHLD